MLTESGRPKQKATFSRLYYHGGVQIIRSEGIEGGKWKNEKEIEHDAGYGFFSRISIRCTVS